MVLFDEFYNLIEIRGHFLNLFEVSDKMVGWIEWKPKKKCKQDKIRLLHDQVLWILQANCEYLFA